jgi:copper chaperone CopZ
MQSKTFQVPNIGCDGCTRAIQNELSALAGVTHVQATVADQKVVVEWGTPATWENIEAKLIEIDYAPAAPLMP